MQRQTQRQKWIIGENIRQKLLEKHFPGAFYGPNRDGPCEWLGSKRDIKRLDAMKDLLFFTHKVTQPLASSVLSETSDSEREAGGLTVLKDRRIELQRRTRVFTRAERGAFLARRVAADCPRAANLNL